jgi:hypothetical protein
MKTRNRSPKSRPVAAVLIVAATVFLLLGRNCGVLGALLAGSADRLLGAAGMGLLCLTAWALAFILATPAGTFSRMVLALWRARPRHNAPQVVVMKTRTVEPYVLQPGESTHPFQNAAAIAPAAAPRDRQTLDAVRSALKGLDYTKAEYEPIVAQMDPSLGFEKLVKSALKSLRVMN